MNSEKKIIQLLAKKIGSEASDDELNELLSLLQKHPSIVFYSNIAIN